ncbi:MAG: alanine--tRNA ligase [Saprospiraceae bacterium]|nr:alanine--tRNA ligase [Saprospiraceae bacterium]MCF8248308.1 alanine--tRNA ligase [Saprospiraceae bacterium]MCF8279938.1 alanine--tRNA ligase [Bacteroidales bacterium]MCF8309836.1 alanine--tRNA ligase [Saprospiraceae bacterium]MCF8438833.1 alanine--tRNA ligase [Saprospiraceae bacterium]
MTAQQIRKTFLDFFISKQHKIVPSAPIVNKDDPTLMFTNAGMNQFKDYFLGTQTPDVRRVADTQKCLRVSGKHNDLEEVGRDGTHHTMFEMLGNWSFGDYFKKEAIAWSWELLTEVYKLPKERLFATVFEGNTAEGLVPDEESRGFWQQVLPTNHVINGNKKDNFWEMGDTGPCGPCTEIHIDLRTDAERVAIPGEQLVNKDHPRVIEIWNNVFIQFNRKADGSLEELPDKHVDTGMGFERLTLAIQGKFNTYDTDIFTPLIDFVEKASGIKYTGQYPDTPTAIANLQTSMASDIAMRVIADHIRAVSFTIADGQLPASGGAGYVIRRILRRAVRYYYSFLNIKEPFLHRLVPMLAEMFADVFPELKVQQEQVAQIIQSEEKSFLNTLENGLKRFASLQEKAGVIAGEDAFELYDTFGFPIDLTRLMAEEKGWSVDEAGFEKAMLAQKERGRSDAEKEVGDWVILKPGDVEFVGYDNLEVHKSSVLRYRTVKTKKGNQSQIVLSLTPFYAESGGQSGDSGWMQFGNTEHIAVLDTLKENELTLHIVERFPKDINANVEAKVDATKRQSTSANHSAVHLMHAAMHQVLGNHALQKGQDVDSERLRFDFSHFQKVTELELRQIEELVNEKVRENIALDEVRNMPIEDAKKLGAMMLFGEKYGDTVRVITFDKDFSQELCGGTHVNATGEIGLFKIVSEGAVAAGVRRIEAVTAANAENYFLTQLEELNEIRGLLKGAQNPAKAIAALQDEVRSLKKQVEQLVNEQAGALKSQLKSQFQVVNGVNFLAAKLPIQDANAVKTLAFQLENEIGNCCIVFGLESDGKPQIMVSVSRSLTEAGPKLHAGNMVRELAKEIQGGGGGQPFFASAGGKDASGLDRAIAKAKEMI